MGASKQAELSSEKWSLFESSLLSSLHPPPSPFSLDLLPRHVALTGTARDLGGPLARAGDPISSSFSQLAAGKGHTLCLESVMWCLTPCATLEICLAVGTDAMTALNALTASKTRTAPRARGAPPINA